MKRGTGTGFLSGIHFGDSFRGMSIFMSHIHCPFFVPKGTDQTQKRARTAASLPSEAGSHVHANYIAYTP